MEDIDLGRDRSHLIDLIYGKSNGSESVSPSLESRETSIPLSDASTKPLKKKPKSNAVKEKKPAKKVACSKGVCICLFLFFVLAVLFAAFAAHYVTKQEYSNMSDSANEPIVSCKNFTRPNKRPYKPIVNEEDADENDVVKTPTKEELALPKSLNPVWYKVSLTPKAGAADGVAEVKLKVEEPTNKIVLNSKGIDFTKDLAKIQISKETTRNKRDSEPVANTKTNRVMAEGSGEEPTMETAVLEDAGVKVTGIEFDDVLEKAVITLDRPLAKGADVVVKIPFSSQVTGNNGLREYKYSVGDETRSMFTTQPSYAYLRHIFPSFDQESFKAPAGLTLSHSKGSKVVANTDVTTDDDGDALTSTLGKVIDPDFVIGDLKSQQANTTGGLELRVWTRPELENSTRYAVDIANQVVDALEHLLQSRLDSKRLDIVGVPGFEAGNRVSRSFIVVPEEELVYNEGGNDVQQKVRIARRLANRIAAQWFGGITSPEEVGTFWLNDALPRYLEVEVLQRILGVDSDDLWTYEIEQLLEHDAKANSVPLRVKNLFSSTEAANFDHVFVGGKGAAILRMLRKSIGDEYFNKAIRNFVTSYRTSYPYDDGLWKSFDKSLGDSVRGWNNETLDVGKFVATWVDQIGFPLVAVEKLDGDNAELSQERFRNDRKTTEKFKYRNAKFWFNWEVPLFMSSADKAQWLHEAFRIPLKESETILLNTDANGFYRVNYEENRWNNIANQLKNNHEEFTPRTRARLLADSFTLANSKVIPFETALNITQYLPKETAVTPWLVVADKFVELLDRLEGTTLQDRVNKFVADKIEAQLQRALASDDEPDYLKSVLRDKLFDLAARTKPERSNAKLNEVFQTGFLANCDGSKLSSECSKVPGDLRDKAYCNGVEFGNDTVFRTIQTLAQKEIDGREKEVLVKSLACYRDPRSLRRLILDSLNSTSLTAELLAAMNKRPVGREVATNLIIDNWSKLKKKFADDPESLNEIVKSGVVVENEREKSMIETFLDHHHKSTSPISAFDEKLESGTSSIYWRKERTNELNDYLDGKMKGPSSSGDAENSEEN
ncbi:unnamed protein product [Caenorhabditis bovis]|uniref:Aminopeptidase n=1 Tax=Caenorhabditis bovis TaxID=2654633 RepID=A0A8S1EAM6_9PELO|nr:unnamed protein product [Caenorhabditis bovis]